MKIVVIGGTGLIGSKTVERLRKKGHDVVAASPNSGVNTITGEGLAEALAGTQVVIDLANSPSFEDKAVLEFFETSGRNLLAAEKAAGVEHHIALSVVGTERLQGSGYFRARMAQENLIRTSEFPSRSSTRRSSSNSWALSPSRVSWGRPFTCPPPTCSRSRQMTSPMRWLTSRLASRKTVSSRLPVRSGSASANSSVDF